MAKNTVQSIERQYNHSYNLYILNNTPDENNGFIRVSQKEQKMLINIPELLNTCYYIFAPCFMAASHRHGTNI